MQNKDTSSHIIRLDQKVVELYPELSRASATKLIAGGKVKIKDKVVTKASYRLRDGDVVFVEYRADEQKSVGNIDLPVLYEDNDVVIIEKPTGVLVHSKGAFNPEPTVATWLQSRLADGMSGQRAGIVHRLDRATSGIMICAKTPEALHWLQKQFSTRKVKKTYYAVVAGHMPHEHAIIDMPIERNPKRPQTFRAGSNGKPAFTEYQVESQNTQYTLLKLNPQTGRTHQLRVHLNEIGHPIVGDMLYGGAPADRLYLHAAQLELTLPNRTHQIFSSAVPTAFHAMINV